MQASPSFTPDRLLDYDEAAARLGVTKRWLQRAVQERRITHHRLGHYVRFSESDLSDFVARTRHVAVGR